MKKFVAAAFCITFFIGLLSIHLFIDYFASASLKRDVEQMLYLFHDAILDAETALSELPAPADFSCSEQTQVLLEDVVFRHPAVRWIGIEGNQGEACYSNPRQVNTVQYQQFPVDDYISLGAKTDDSGSTDLIYIIRRDGLDYIAALNPFMYVFMAEYACQNCIEYELIIDTKPELMLGQDTFDGPAEVSYSTEMSQGQLSATLIMAGNKEFIEYYRDTSMLFAALISLVLATIVALLNYRLLKQRQSLVRVISDAIAANEFKPYYQGIVDSRTGEVVGAEVLARWIRKDGTVIPPYQFIGVAEDHGLIMDITDQLVQQVGRDLRQFNWRGTDKFASINIVPEHLLDDEFLNLICDTAKRHDLTLNNFSVELTERKKINDLKTASSAIARYHEQKIDTKLDDAGTGYGGFSYVQELGIKTIKIDKMFVDTIMHSDDIKHSVLNAIVAFANSSNMNIIAEGVESEEQVTYLSGLGVYLIQGYVYSKPVDAGSFVNWLKQNSA